MPRRPTNKKGGSHGEGKQSAEARAEEAREEGGEEAVASRRHVPAFQMVSLSDRAHVLSEVVLAAGPGMATERAFVVDMNGAKVLCVSVLTGQGNYNFTTVVVGKDGVTGSVARIGFAPDEEMECAHDDQE